MNSHRTSRGGGHRRSNVLGLTQRNADARQRKLTQPARAPPPKTPGAQHKSDGNDEHLWAEPPKEISGGSTNVQNDIWAAQHQVAELLRQNPNESDQNRNTRYYTIPPKRKGSSEIYSNNTSNPVEMSGNQFGFGQPTGTSGTTQGNLFSTSNTTGSVFGNTGNANTTSGTTGGGLFGTAGSANTSSNIFGGGSGRSSPFSFGNTTQSATTPQANTAPAATQASSGTTLFGNTSGSTGGGLFGGQQQQTSTTPAGGSLFGNTASNTSNTTSGTSSNIFGSMTNQSSSTAPSSAGGLFGAKTGSTGSTFGSNATTPSSQAQKPLFGAGASNTTAPSTSGNTFGGFSVGNTATTPQPTRPSPLAQSTTPAGNPPSSIFGAQTNQAAPATSATTGAPAFKFPTNTAGADSATASANTNKPLFGELNKTAQSTTPSGSGFSFPSNTAGGQTPAAQTPGAGATASGSSIFTPSTTQSTQTAAPTAPASAGLFGQTANAGAGASTTANLFGNTAQASTPPAPQAPSAGGLFSQKPATGAQGSSTPSLFNPTQQSSTTPTAPATAPTASLFSNLNTQSTATTTQPAATSTPPTAAPSTFSLGGSGATSSSAQPAAATATATPSLFGQNTTTTNAAQGTSAAAPSITIGAGSQPAGAAASTTGPAPPTTSRLAQKSMDEILTMWSTSLASHQKTFQQLATQVSKWDRQLVENSGKISSLYGRCFQAERDCTEVERQLSAVEHGQVELEAALERYEAQVDRMIESSGGDEGAVGGVEGERERTYKTAEVCSNRLSEMSHSLTDMIEEINVASNKLHNTQTAATSATGTARQDDPLAQIVRVLNSHLSQLQTIDEGARTLGQKVEQAQKDAQVLGQNQGVNGAGWVESFGRSYLGRS